MDIKNQSIFDCDSMTRFLITQTSEDCLESVQSIDFVVDQRTDSVKISHDVPQLLKNGLIRELQKRRRHLLSLLQLIFDLIDLFQRVQDP